MTLAGVDSVMCPKPRRIEAWRRLAEDLPDATIETVAHTIPLEGIPQGAEDIMANRVKLPYWLSTSMRDGVRREVP